MTYSKSNPPLICMQTMSSCYKGTYRMQVKGVLVHSTGANNPNLARYVQPSDNDLNKARLLDVIGTNRNRNDWNHVPTQAGLNAWIGKLADGTVAAVQSMPWDYRPWGCGSGKKGSCNSGWVQFEICEDALNDRAYFEKTYKEAVELTAYICKTYGLDPTGTTTLNGVKVPVILCHADSYKLGLGSNHGDILHWWPKFGKSMDDFRNDVKKAMDGGTVTTAPAPQKPGKKPRKTLTERGLWDVFKAAGLNDYGVAGLMGNLYNESACSSVNLQNTGNKALGMSDVEYTDAVDAGTYTADRFEADGHGYGLAQWTYKTRKRDLLNAAKRAAVSVGDATMQAQFLMDELTKSYPAVLSVLKNAKTVREASDAVLLQFERPANQGEAVRVARAKTGKAYFDKYAAGAGSPVAGVPGSYRVKVDTPALNVRKGPGTSYGLAGCIRDCGVYTITETRGNWGRLKSGAGWICLDYVKKA